MFEAVACDKTAPKSLHELACDCEALLFVSREPLTLDEFVRLTASPKKAVEKALKLIQRLFRHRGIQIEATPKGWQFVPAVRSKAVIAAYHEAPCTLSDEALETLAVIAYLQPIDEAGIAEIRSQDDPAHALDTLLFVGLIKRVAGDKGDAKFITTEFFLQSSSLNSLDDLPCLT